MIIFVPFKYTQVWKAVDDYEQNEEIYWWDLDQFEERSFLHG